MKRIGILGGTFDPVHNAHVDLACAARDQQQLDCVLFIPAGMPARKYEHTQASPEERLHMLELACRNIPKMKVLRLEIDRPGISYTIDTLHEIKRIYGSNCQLYLILGEDAARDVGTWKDAASIAKLVTVLYAKRSFDASLQPFATGFAYRELKMPVTHLSSSMVRDCISRGEDVSGLIPSAVLEYIKEHGLYE